MRYLLIIGLLIQGYGSYSEEVIDGSVIFTANCAACHTIGQGQLVGPDLKGVTDKYDKSWIARFIRESQNMIAEGDEKAIAVFNAYSMIPMPAAPLNDKEIDALLDHIRSESKADVKSMPVVSEDELNRTPPKVSITKKQLPKEQNDSTRKALVTGFWLAFSAALVMGVGIWWATR
ncbi:MAG: cytochrome c [Cyclobacteriaceae bacterium]